MAGLPNFSMTRGARELNSSPGESRLYKVGKYKVLLTRGERLDYYGNPVHTASLVKDGRTVGYSAKTNGTATLTVSEMLKKNGIETKHHKRRRKQNRP